MAKAQKVPITNGHWGYILFMAYIGSFIYFVDRNEGFWGVLLAFIQAAVWPAYVLYEALKLLAV